MTVVTSTLSVTLRGTSTALAQVNEENLRVVADLKNVSDADGVYTVPATVYVDGLDVGAVGSYQVTVRLSGGQKVVVESSNKRLYGVMLLVYAVPIVLFLIGYFASYALTSEGLRYAVAIAAFCLGIVPAILYDRKLKREGGLAFTIIRTL